MDRRGIGPRHAPCKGVSPALVHCNPWSAWLDSNERPHRPKRRGNSLFPTSRYGAPRRIQTSDPLFTKEPLWPLSYRSLLVPKTGIEPAPFSFEASCSSIELLGYGGMYLSRTSLCGFASRGLAARPTCHWWGLSESHRCWMVMSHLRNYSSQPLLARVQGVEPQPAVLETAILAIKLNSHICLYTTYHFTKCKVPNLSIDIYVQ